MKPKYFIFLFLALLSYSVILIYSTIVLSTIILDTVPFFGAEEVQTIVCLCLIGITYKLIEKFFKQ